MGDKKTPPPILPPDFNFGASAPDTLPADFSFEQKAPNEGLSSPSLPVPDEMRNGVNPAKRFVMGAAAAAAPLGEMFTIDHLKKMAAMTPQQRVDNWTGYTPDPDKGIIGQTVDAAKATAQGIGSFAGYDRMKEGDVAGGIGEGMSNAAQAFVMGKILGKIAPKQPNIEKADANLTTAANPSKKVSSRLLEATRNATPELQQIAQTNRPSTVSDAAAAVKSRSLQLEGQYQALKNPVAQNSVNTASVANAIDSNINPAMRKTDPSLAQQINSAASNYRTKRWTVQDLEDRRNALNSELESTLEQTGLSKAQALRDPRTKYKYAELRAVKDALYNAIGGDAGAIKEMQSNLQIIQKAMESQAGNIVKADQRSMARTPLDTAALAGQKLMDLKPGTATKMVVDAIRGASATPNAQIQRAFENYSPANPNASRLGAGALLTAFLKDRADQTNKK